MAQCKITLERVPPVEAWTNEQFTDWLHPMHGPLPNNLISASSDTDHYVIAVWLNKDCVITVLECPQKPVGRGAILWSARWAYDEHNRLVDQTSGQVVTKPLDWYRNKLELYQAFIPEVIKEAESASLGNVTKGRQKVIRNGAWLRKST